MEKNRKLLQIVQRNIQKAHQEMIAKVGLEMNICLLSWPIKQAIAQLLDPAPLLISRQKIAVQVNECISWIDGCMNGRVNLYIIMKYKQVMNK